MIRHFFVCTNMRPDGASMQACGNNGGFEIASALRIARQRNRMVEDVSSPRRPAWPPCPERGTTVCVYPEGVWYTGVTTDDVEELVEEHMVGGRPIERLRNRMWEPER